MTLQQWANNGWLEPHVTSPERDSQLYAEGYRAARTLQALPLILGLTPLNLGAS